MIAMHDDSIIIKFSSLLFPWSSHANKKFLHQKSMQLFIYYKTWFNIYTYMYFNLITTLSSNSFSYKFSQYMFIAV